MVVEDRQEREPGDLGHSYQFVLEFKYEYGMIENKYGKKLKKSSMEKLWSIHLTIAKQIQGKLSINLVWISKRDIYWGYINLHSRVNMKP